MNAKKKQNEFLLGLKDGIPIGIGYLAVSFALGITAKAAGITAGQGFIMSIINLASAGEYAGIKVIAERSPYILMFFMTLIVNARYFLMSCSFSQKFSPNTPLRHKLYAGFFLTDEIFGISVSRDGYLDYRYTLGAGTIAAPLWAIGTSLGIIAGHILPDNIVAALSVMLYAMFICIVVPKAKDDKKVAIIVIISLILSLAASLLPYVKEISEGGRTLVLTIVISAVAAFVFPRETEDTSDEH